MKLKRTTLFLCFLGAICLALEPIVENFDHPAASLWSAYKYESPATFQEDGGIDNSACAKLAFNGQSLQIGLPEPLVDRPLSVSFKIRLNLHAAFVRVVFGSGKINWTTYQGAYDLRAGLMSAGWHDIRMELVPHPVKGGRYSVYIDGLKLYEGVMVNGTKATDRFGIIYLRNGLDDPAFIDDFKAEYGERIPRPLVETVSVEFPPPEKTIFRQADFRIPFVLRGNFAPLRNLRLALHHNTRNFHAQAKKEAVMVVPLQIAEDGTSATADLRNVPFGLFTAKILVDTEDGAAHVIREEFVCHTHPAPKMPSAYPIRWAMDCAADRPSAFWKKELDALVAAGINWTRLEINLWGVTPKNKQVVHLGHHLNVLKAMEERGIHCFVCLNCRPQWHGLTAGSDSSCLATEEDWAEVCRQVMTAFKGRVNLYEIWNEPQHYNWVHFEPGIINEEHYGKLLQVSRRVAAEISPDIQVMGPCITANMNEWINGVARVKGFEGIRYFSIHTNNFPDYRTPFYLEKVKEVTGQDMEPFTTESSNDLRRLVASFAGETNSNSFGYCIFDQGTNPLYAEHNNGMVKNTGVPKDRHVAYAWCATMLNHADYVGRIFPNDGISGYLFKEAGMYKAVVFAERRNRLPALASAPGVKVYDLLGNPFQGNELEVIPPGASVYDRAEPNFMAYLVNLPPDAPEVVAAEVNCLATYRKFKTGNGEKMPFAFGNTSSRPRTYTLRLKDKQGLHFGKPLTVTVQPGERIEKGLEFQPDDTLPLAEIYFDGEVETDGVTIPRSFGPVRVVAASRFKRTVVWKADGKNPLYWPQEKQYDIHKDHSTGLQRKEQDQTEASKGSGIRLVKVADVNHEVARCQYSFARPAKGWHYSVWLCSRYKFRKPIPLPGIPLRVTMRLFMPDNVKSYPLVMMYTFRDKTGKEIYIEGSNLFFSGWRDNECFLPSLITHGRLTDAHGGNKLKAIDSYPLELTGIIIHLIPITSSTHAPKDLPAVKGYLLFDQLELEYYD